MTLCDVCGVRPMKEFVVVRAVEDPTHVAKARMCAVCFGEVSRQLIETPKGKTLPHTVESVSQQDFDAIVNHVPENIPADRYK